MRNKWGIVPSAPVILIGTHPIERYKSRIADTKNARETLTNNVLNGTVVLERTGVTYMRCEDNMIVPCVRHEEPNMTKLVVKTVLDKKLKVFFTEVMGC